MRDNPLALPPRPVRLESQAITWIEDLRSAWRDHLDNAQALSVWIAHPKPPQLRGRPAACHVILEQAAPADGKACLLTGLLTGARMNGMLQGAFAVSSPITFHDAAQTFGPFSILR